MDVPQVFIDLGNAEKVIYSISDSSVISRYRKVKYSILSSSIIEFNGYPKKLENALSVNLALIKQLRQVKSRKSQIQRYVSDQLYKITKSLLPSQEILKKTEVAESISDLYDVWSAKYTSYRFLKQKMTKEIKDLQDKVSASNSESRKSIENIRMNRIQLRENLDITEVSHRESVMKINHEMEQIKSQIEHISDENHQLLSEISHIEGEISINSADLEEKKKVFSDIASKIENLKLQIPMLTLDVQGSENRLKELRKISCFAQKNLQIDSKSELEIREKDIRMLEKKREKLRRRAISSSLADEDSDWLFEGKNV